MLLPASTADSSAGSTDPPDTTAAVVGPAGTRSCIHAATATATAGSTRASDPEILPDGTLTFFRPDGTTQIRANRTSGNLYDDIAGNLSATKNHSLLDRVTLVDQTGGRIVYVREGSTWTRE